MLLSVSVGFPMCLSVSVCVCLCRSLSVCALPVFVPVRRCLSVRVFVAVSSCLILSVNGYPSLSVCVCVCVCLRVSFPLTLPGFLCLRLARSTQGAFRHIPIPGGLL